MKINDTQSDISYILNNLDYQPKFIDFDDMYFYVCFDKIQKHKLDSKYFRDFLIWNELFSKLHSYKVLK